MALIPDPKVARRYGRTVRTINRWDKKPELKFPPPRYIRGQKYRVTEELDVWDATRPSTPDRDLAGHLNRLPD